MSYFSAAADPFESNIYTNNSSPRNAQITSGYSSPQYTRSTISSYNYSTDQLRSEINNLRHQIDQVNSSHKIELQRISQSHEQRLRQAQVQNQQKQQNLQQRIQQLEHQLMQERERERELRNQLGYQKSQHLSEMSRLQCRVKSLADELEQTKARNSAKHREEIQRLRQEKDQTEHSHKQELEKYRNQHYDKVQGLKKKLYAQEEVVQKLEREANNLKRLLNERIERGRNDVRALQDTLESTKRVLELQQQDLARLKQQRDEALKESQALQCELDHLHVEIERVKRDNTMIRQEMPVLEKKLTRGVTR